jgi:hypothetical protein
MPNHSILNAHDPSDYYPFGLMMPGRSWSDGYRFGFNGHEKVDEIYGPGSHFTAMFWEMDPRVCRRWNQDPKPNPSISNYSIFINNPIRFSDFLGDTITLGKGTINNLGFLKWKDSNAGQRFYNRYDVGGKQDHINVEIDFVNDIKTSEGTRLAASGLTEAFVTDNGDRKKLVNQDWYDGAKARGTDVSGYATTVRQGESLSFKLQFTGKDAVDAGGTLLHETQHVRIQDFANQMYGKPMLYNVSEQHVIMLNNYSKPGLYTLQYKSRWSMSRGNQIYDFNAERWDYFNQYRLLGETDADIDRKAYESGESNLFMLD